jgi:hypothetical protein
MTTRQWLQSYLEFYGVEYTDTNLPVRRSTLADIEIAFVQLDNILAFLFTLDAEVFMGKHEGEFVAFIKLGKRPWWKGGGYERIVEARGDTPLYTLECLRRNLLP